LKKWIWPVRLEQDFRDHCRGLWVEFLQNLEMKFDRDGLFWGIAQLGLVHAQLVNQNGQG
jgi:hypothetical protein